MNPKPRGLNPLNTEKGHFWDSVAHLISVDPHWPFNISRDIVDFWGFLPKLFGSIFLHEISYQLIFLHEIPSDTRYVGIFGDFSRNYSDQYFSMKYRINRYFSMKYPPIHDMSAYQRAFESHFLSNHKVRDCLDCFQKQLLVFLKQKFVWKTFSTCVFKYFLIITFISDAFFSTNFFLIFVHYFFWKNASKK